MIVDCAVYRDGRRRAGDLDIEAAGRARREEGAFVWLGVHEPTAEEFDAVRREFGLHELAVEDAVSAHQRPKLETYGDTLFVVLKTVHYIDSEDAIETGEILLFLARDFVVSVRHGAGAELGSVRRRVEERPDLLGCGPGAVLYAIVDHVVDGYEPAADGLDIDIGEVERDVFSPERTNPAERIYFLSREVLEFHHAVAPLASAVDGLARGRHELLDPDLREYFRDVHDHLLRLIARVEAQRDLLSGALQANLTQVSVAQNEDMRRISAWVAIVAVPTAVAGIYGMNFDHMPELEWTFGYPAVIAFMVTVCTVLYWRFRRAGWL